MFCGLLREGERRSGEWVGGIEAVRGGEVSGLGEEVILEGRFRLMGEGDG